MQWNCKPMRAGLETNPGNRQNVPLVITCGNHNWSKTRFYIKEMSSCVAKSLFWEDKQDIIKSESLNNALLKRFKSLLWCEGTMT